MRILLVEDHPQLAESVAQALRAAGWTLDLLNDGVAADLALATEDYALAILDVGLPRMDGFQVLARLRERGKTRPAANASRAAVRWCMTWTPAVSASIVSP